MNRFIKLSGIAVQMGITIFIGAYFGKWLDQKYALEKNWFTIGLTLLAIAIAMFFVLRQLNQLNKE